MVHIDDGAIAAISQFFKEQIPENSEVLDLMSSWRSHWPYGHPKKRMIGLGLNDVELRENPDLDGYVVHNVNTNPILPVNTIHQVGRILRPGGKFVVSFSNRMFPTKAVLNWRNSTDRGRVDLVGTYMESAESFEDIQASFLNPDTSPPNDPMYAVYCRKPLV